MEALRGELAEKEAALEELRATTPADLWLRDLDALEEALGDYNETLHIVPACEVAKGRAAGGRGGKKAKKGGWVFVCLVWVGFCVWLVWGLMETNPVCTFF